MLFHPSWWLLCSEPSRPSGSTSDAPFSPQMRAGLHLEPVIWRSRKSCGEAEQQSGHYMLEWSGSLILVASSLLSSLVLAVTRETLIQNQPFFRPEVSEGRESTTYESDLHGWQLSFPENVHIGSEDDAAKNRGILCSFFIFFCIWWPVSPCLSNSPAYQLSTCPSFISLALHTVGFKALLMDAPRATSVCGMCRLCRLSLWNKGD